MELRGILMENETIAQIVSRDYRTAAVFKKYGIDFCCGGKVLLAETCEQKGVDKFELLNELEEAQQTESDQNITETLELDALSDHIVNVHHYYVRKRLPEITPFLDKVVNVHGESHPELLKVQELFNGVKKELTSHMKKEEMVLFPYIKEMVRVQREQKSFTQPPFGTIKNPIRLMEQEHQYAGDGFRIMKSITNNFIPPENACNTYRVTFSMLDEFENDVHKHVHLENNILFPRAISLEYDLLS